MRSSSGLYVFKGIRNIAIGAFQFMLPLPTWLLAIVASVCFGTAILWFWKAHSLAKRGA